MTQYIRRRGSSTPVLPPLEKEESQRLEMLADRIAFQCIKQLASGWLEAMHQLPDCELPHRVSFAIPDVIPTSPYNVSCRELNLDPVGTLRSRVKFGNGPEIQEHADLRYQFLAQQVGKRLEDLCASVQMTSSGRLALSLSAPTKHRPGEVPFYSLWVVSDQSSLEPTAKPLHHCAKYDYPVTVEGRAQDSIRLESMERILRQYINQSDA